MGYVPPTLDELPIPTRKEFNRNPEFYYNKIRLYQRKQCREAMITAGGLIVGTFGLVAVILIVAISKL